MARKEITMVHECGCSVEVIDDGVAPHFIVAELHMDMCPRCYRNLINDWMDESWRFWTPEAWTRLDIWSGAVATIEEAS